MCNVITKPLKFPFITLLLEGRCPVLTAGHVTSQSPCKGTNIEQRRLGFCTLLNKWQVMARQGDCTSCADRVLCTTCKCGFRTPLTQTKQMKQLDFIFLFIITCEWKDVLLNGVLFQNHSQRYRARDSVS